MDQEKEIKDVISILRDELDLDGEIMQRILKEVGMEWQMLRQLMLTMPIEQVNYLIEERADIEVQDYNVFGKDKI
jgi:hypothetical protein